MLKCLLFKSSEWKAMRRKGVWNSRLYGAFSFGKTRQSSPFPKAQPHRATLAIPYGSLACRCMFTQVVTPLGWQRPNGLFLWDAPCSLQPRNNTMPLPGLVQGRCLSQEEFYVPRLQDGWNGKHNENGENEQISWQEQCCGLQEAAELEEPQLQHARAYFQQPLSPGWGRAWFSAACMLSGHAINNLMPISKNPPNNVSAPPPQKTPKLVWKDLWEPALSFPGCMIP